MGHEDAVYLAKLAEQAERYEGASFSFSDRLLRGYESRLMLTWPLLLHRNGREHEGRCLR